MIDNQRHNRRQRKSAGTDLLLPEANQVAQQLQGHQPVRVAFMLEQEIDVGDLPIMQPHLIKQVGLMRLHLLINESIFFQREGIQIKQGRNFVR